jgi:hypothetical protein
VFHENALAPWLLCRRVSKENVAATGPYHFESDFAKDANSFPAADPRKPRHTEIC